MAFLPDFETDIFISYARVDNETAGGEGWLATFKGHEGSVSAVAFAPDGKTLFSAGGDSDGKKDFSIRLWRAATDADVARQRNR